MKFTDYKYEHMDIEALQAQLKAICSKLQSAASYDDFKNAFIELNDVNKYINTNQTLVDVRHTVDTRDEYYTKENDFFASSGAKTPMTVVCERSPCLSLALRLQNPSASQRLGLKLK